MAPRESKNLRLLALIDTSLRVLFLLLPQPELYLLLSETLLILFSRQCRVLGAYVDEIQFLQVF